MSLNGDGANVNEVRLAAAGSETVWARGACAAPKFSAAGPGAPSGVPDGLCHAVYRKYDPLMLNECSTNI